MGRCAPVVKTMVLTCFASAVAAGEVTPAPADAAAAFRADCAERAREADRADRFVIKGTDGWLFLTKELRHLGHGRFWGKDASRNSRLRHPDPLPCIVGVSRGLGALGIELWVVPIPPKAVVYPDKALSKPFDLARRLDATLSEFYQALRKRGVRVVDLTPELLVARAEGERAAYCERDSHFSGVGCVRVAAVLAEALRKRDWYACVPKQAFVHESRNVEITGDLAGAAGTGRASKETLRLRFVGRKTPGGLEPVPDDPASPVVLMGDSHCLVFHAGDDLHARGAGLADQLALELGFAVDVVAVRGSGATASRVNLYRQSRGNPGYLQGKKVVLWIFAAREFTETDRIGWKPLPVRPRR
jgi:alginate O-acetyltransferase complex protein AlgJ